MTVRVVNALEVIHVNYDQAAGRVIATPALNFLTQRRAKAPAIKKPGQVIAVCFGTQLVKRLPYVDELRRPRDEQRKLRWKLKVIESACFQCGAPAFKRCCVRAYQDERDCGFFRTPQLARKLFRAQALQSLVRDDDVGPRSTQRDERRDRRARAHYREPCIFQSVCEGD
jgi:hypothetical protein